MFHFGYKTALDKYEMRRLIAWFDDKFHKDVTVKLLNERVIKKITGEGFPESKHVIAGMKAIKFHLDYMSELLATKFPRFRICSANFIYQKIFFRKFSRFQNAVTSNTT